MVTPSAEELAALDQDAKEVLAEMEKEANEATEVAQPQTEDKVEEEKQEETSKPEETKPAEINSEISRQIPLAKYQEKKKKLEAELQAERDKNRELEEKLKNSPQPTEAKEDTRLSDIAKKWKLDEELVKDLGSVFSKDSIPSDVLEEINELREEKRINERKQQVEDQYIKEFSELEKTFKDVDFTNIDKEKLKELAFSDKYAHTPLDVIFKAFKDDIQKPIKRAGAVEGYKPIEDVSVGDFSKMTDEDAMKLSDEDFDKFNEYKSRNGSLLRK